MNILEVEDLLLLISEYLNSEDKINYLLALRLRKRVNSQLQNYLTQKKIYYSTFIGEISSFLRWMVEIQYIFPEKNFSELTDLTKNHIFARSDKLNLYLEQRNNGRLTGIEIKMVNYLVLKLNDWIFI